jgi:hypothetical protein
VWIVPTTAAALAIILVVLVSLVLRSGDDTPAVQTTSTTTTATPFVRDPNGPAGSRAHPFAVGESGVIAGWRITVQSAGGQGPTLTANVFLQWDGREGAGLGEPAQLVLSVEDATGTMHRLGGSACPGDPAGDLAKVPRLDIGRTATVALCWTVGAADHASAAVVASDKAVPGSTFYAVA